MTAQWINPITKKGVISKTGSCEVTPFVFKDKLYLLENFKKAEEFPGKPLQYKFHEDGFRIRDVESDKIICTPLLNHYFATAFVWDHKVYVFCGNYGRDKPWWNIEEIEMIFSEDLINWSDPEVIIKGEDGEFLFNNSVCFDGRRFVMLVETNNKKWVPFTFKYYQSQNLTDWKLIDGAVYGTDKYVGGPALYFLNNYYYTLYLNDLGGKYDTRITRSKNLMDWEEAPDERPFLTFDPNHKTDPVNYPDVYEINASDVDMCEFKGKTIIYFNGGDQATCGDLQLAEFDGTMEKLLPMFFE